MPSLDDVRSTLETARHGYLSTASSDGDPHLQPVVFQVVKNRSTSPSTRNRKQR